MPKPVVSPLIYEGLYEFILRINLKRCAIGHIDKNIKQSSGNPMFYIMFPYSKKDFTLEQVIQERNEKIVMYEKLGFRSNRNQRFHLNR